MKRTLAELEWLQIVDTFSSYSYYLTVSIDNSLFADPIMLSSNEIRSVFIFSSYLTFFKFPFILIK